MRTTTMATTKTDLASLTEAEKLTLLQSRLLDQFLTAMSAPKAPPAALLVACSRFLSSDPVQVALKKAQTTASKKQAATAPLELPVFEPYDPDEWQKGSNGSASQASPEGPGAAPRIGRYPSDPEEH
jgi:hypothetical protein